MKIPQSFLEQAKSFEDLHLARVSFQSKDLYRVHIEGADILAQISGKFRHQSQTHPAVGDYVMIDRITDAGGHAIIHELLLRQTLLKRRASGSEHHEQLIAANVDVLFICMALNQDFNLRRLERYLTLAYTSGVTPVIILTKADLSDDLQAALEAVSEVAIGVDVIMSSTVYGMGEQAILDAIEAGQTIAFVGSSGVGKSTLINRLMGEVIMETQETRSDDKGRHTTTARQLFHLKNGTTVIDTPGMRELGLEQVDVSQSFEDIKRLEQSCKFSDCQHVSEPGCAVKDAIEASQLSEERLASYQKLQKEASYEGLNHKQREVQKMNTMFAEVGGMKNARDIMKNSPRRR